MSLYEAKSLEKYLAQILSFIKGQYLAQIKFQIVKQVGCVDAALSFIHRSQFFPIGKFIPAIFSLNPNYANLEANFLDVSSQNGRKTEISVYFRFNLLLLISIFSAVLKENAN